MELERAKQALINADRAGDTAAAKQIANYIKSQEQPENLSSSVEKQKPMSERLKAGALGMSTAQIPFANVISSGLAAGAMTPFLGEEGESIPETYSRLYGEGQDYAQKMKEMYPDETLAGNVLGIATTLPAAFSKGGGGMTGGRELLNKGVVGAKDFAGKVAGFSPFKGSGPISRGLADAGNLATRMAGSAAVAAPVGGLYAAGEAEPGQRWEQFKEGGAGAAAVGAAFPVAGAVIGGAAKGAGNLIKGLGARVEDDLSAALGKLKGSSSKFYEKADQSGLAFAPSYMDDMLSDLGKKVIKSKDLATQKLYSKTLGALDDLAQDISSGNTGLMTLDRHRQILGNLSKDITNPNKAQEAQAAGRAIEIIDDFIDKATDANLVSGSPEATQFLNDARKLWSQSKKFENISKIISGAGNDANKLKRDLERFRLNPKNTLGWSAEEKEALKQASMQTTGEGLLKMFGKFGIDLGDSRSAGNTFLPVVGGAAGGALGPVGMVAVPAAGTLARSGQKLIAAGKAENLLKMIEQGAEISKQMIDELPQEEKNKFMKSIMQMPAAKASSILKGRKVK